MATTDTVMSRKTYATPARARAACDRDCRQFQGVHLLPSGRYCYLYRVTFKKTSK